VVTTPGFKEAFRSSPRAAGRAAAPEDFGGQGLPKTIGAACIEMLQAANISFALCPLLTDGAIEALLTAGSEQKQPSSRS
jgi:alkylation response protein AidB-like acyl-CoA dehydrogenase